MIGARMHFAVPRILAEAGLLHTLYTDVYVGNKRWLARILDSVPSSLRPDPLQRLTGRFAAGIPNERVISFDSLGLWYYYQRRKRNSVTSLAALFANVNHRFGQRVISRGLNGTRYVWGFNRASWEIFAHARQRGIKCILEQSMAPRALELGLLTEEIKRWPKWQLDDCPPVTDALAKREIAEWRLADKIVCPSDFVAGALQREGVDPDNLSVIPYGIDTRQFQTTPRRPSRTTNLLFVGEVSLQKGIPYLLEALRSINRPKSIKAKLVGHVLLDRQRLNHYSNWCEVTGPIPRSQIRALYEWADILVLPSLCEGSATVTYEAIAAGLPLIVTPNTGSLVRDGVEGFVVPIRDSRVLAERIEMLCDDIDRRAAMADAAAQRTQEVSIEAYAERLLRALSLTNDDSVQS
jgi:glycosyltransferase involved in cell wall biosynthesis